jgi:hypothetical protein
MGVFAVGRKEPPMAGRNELEALVARGCSEPGCDCSGVPLALGSKCHASASVVAVYWRGTLRLVCAECESPILDVAVKAI